ncbi:MAG: polyprenyl synthetase family protein [Anaerolineales bacterium]|nr:polyprenyl synthetase family protein [Anaerolineales bacterium]
MTLQHYIDEYLPAIETELQHIIGTTKTEHYHGLHEMLAYAMGWKGEGAGPRARGKRVRPLLVLLTNASAGGSWEKALPAAAAVELVHNFSLIHDDIEDNSPLRRGRPTVWKLWGIAQAINTGDTMFTLAQQAVTLLKATTTPTITLEATQLIQQTCLHLTQGQFLDISYEDRADLVIEDYWPMVRGKTAALLATSTELGALVANVDSETRNAYHNFGCNLGLAFQAQDDYLGIWGDTEITGKSVASDLVECKKSLPVLYGLGKNGAFAERWRSGPITQEEVPEIAHQLELEGGRAFTKSEAERLTARALQDLEDADPQGDAGDALSELANKLLKRDV